MRVCPHCAEELPDDVRICTQCGKDATTEPDWRTTPRRADREPWWQSGGPDMPGPPPTASGLPPQPTPPTGRTPFGRQPVNTLAVLSLVVVLLSGGLAFVSWWLSLAANVIGLVMAGVAMQQIRTSAEPDQGAGFGFALAALILGALGLLSFLRWVLVL